MSSSCVTVDELRSFYAGCVASAGRLPDRPVGSAFEIRLEGAFEAVPREMFLPPGPWYIAMPAGYVKTPSANPVYVYQDGLVAIDKDREINNGQPSFHARIMGWLAPEPGETVVHIGAGTGYYSSILAMLVAPGGRVHAFEVDDKLATAGRRNLHAFDGVSVTVGDATKLAMPGTHVLYVNAGVRSPPAHWLKALHPGGRMFLPWWPARGISIALAIKRVTNGYQVEPKTDIRVIPCVGAFETSPEEKPPSKEAAWATRALHLTAERPPDETATAVFGEVWFSSGPLDQS